MQTQAWPLGTFNLRNSAISVKGNRFLLTGFRSWRSQEHSCSEPSSPMRPRASLAPQKLTSQNHAQKFPISLSVHQPVMLIDPHPPWNVHLWVSESPSPPCGSLLQDLGYIVFSLCVALRKPCAVLHCPRKWSPGRHMFLHGTLPLRVSSHPLGCLRLWWALHLLVRPVLLFVQGAGPEAQKAQVTKTQRERAYTKL